MPNKPLCHPITSNKITQGGWVGRRNETVRCKTLVYARGKNWLENETRNSYHLILKGVCCAINPFEHVLVQRGQIPQLRPLTQIKHNSLFGTERSLLRIRTNSKQQQTICLINLSATKRNAQKTNGALSNYEVLERKAKRSCWAKASFDSTLNSKYALYASLAQSPYICMSSPGTPCVIKGPRRRTATERMTSIGRSVRKTSSGKRPTECGDKTILSKNSRTVRARQNEQGGPRTSGNETNHTVIRRDWTYGRARQS